MLGLNRVLDEECATLNAQVMLVILIATSMVAAWVIHSVPGWSFQPMVVDRLWQLHDDLIDNVRAGRLGHDDPGVAELLRMSRVAATHAHQLSLADYLVARRVKSMPGERSMRTKLPDGPEKDLFNQFSERLSILVPMLVFTSTWTGAIYTTIHLGTYLIRAGWATYRSRPRLDHVQPPPVEVIQTSYRAVRIVACEPPAPDLVLA